ncbi:hypothetical protein PLICRDRAFT_171510 [Plicaturopsis crispa FD-325 SS-3]|nr:hypothetical protein PLICRDRAFT_171510 [Plicaturopsis crispa FD-325 SS-3]
MSHTTTSFSFGERLGLLFIVQTALLSMVSVVGMLLWLMYNAIAFRKQGSRKWSTTADVHYYLLNLLVCDLVHTIGILKHIGDIGVALTSLVIGIDTFNVVVLRWTAPKQTALVVLGVMWLFISLVVGLSYRIHQGEGFYGDTQYWCWITDRFRAEQIVLDYLWIWIASFLNCIIYGILALVVNGFIGGGKLRISSSSTGGVIGRRDSARRGGRTVATQMLFYPAVYIITVLPIAVARFMHFGGHGVPFPATAFSDILYVSSGILDVILFSFTRPTLLPDRYTDNDYSLPPLSTPPFSQHTLRSPRSRGEHLPDAIDDSEDWITSSF